MFYSYDDSQCPLQITIKLCPPIRLEGPCVIWDFHKIFGNKNLINSTHELHFIDIGFFFNRAAVHP